MMMNPLEAASQATSRNSRVQRSSMVSNDEISPTNTHIPVPQEGAGLALYGAPSRITLASNPFTVLSAKYLEAPPSLQPRSRGNPTKTELVWIESSKPTKDRPFVDRRIKSGDKVYIMHFQQPENRPRYIKGQKMSRYCTWGHNKLTSQKALFILVILNHEEFVTPTTPFKLISVEWPECEVGYTESVSRTGNKALVLGNRSKQWFIPAIFNMHNAVVEQSGEQQQLLRNPELKMCQNPSARRITPSSSSRETAEMEVKESAGAPSPARSHSGSVDSGRRSLDSSNFPPAPPTLERRYSNGSMTALNLLRQFEFQAQEYENRTMILLHEIEEGRHNTAFTNEVAQLNGLLDKLQFEGVDSVITTTLVSGREEARMFRRSLNGRCEELRKTLWKMHRYLREVSYLHPSPS